MGFLRNAELDAARKGVVGIRDYEMAENIDTWIDRFAQGLDGFEFRPACIRSASGRPSMTDGTPGTNFPEAMAWAMSVR